MSDISLASIEVPFIGASPFIKVFSGKPIFLVGANGTGKSALVQYIVARLPPNVIFAPGSRTSSFDQESLSITAASRRLVMQNMASWNSATETRWRNLSGTMRNEKAIHDLQSAEIQFKVDAANDIKCFGLQSSAIFMLQSNNSPLDRLNRVLAQAGLAPQLFMLKGELRAIHANGDYSVAKMSDGERAAVILASDVIAANPATIFVLDEPELHIHRSIVLPLLSALIKEREDCGFIVSTHELSLPAEWLNSETILVRKCQWSNDQPASWTVDVLPSNALVPEELRITIFGARNKIVFVEGTSSSLDTPLYTLLFPNASIQSKATSREVRQAVLGLRATMGMHHVEAFGIVDNDDLSPSDIEDSRRNSIYCLPVISIESLYYCREVRTSIAEQKRHLGSDPVAIQAEAELKAFSVLSASVVEHLAARLCEQRIRTALMLKAPDRNQVASLGASPITVSLVSPFPAELAIFQNYINDRDLEAILARYPVRYGGLLDAIARGLGFKTRFAYEKAALTRVAAEPDLREFLRSRLGALSQLLD